FFQAEDGIRDYKVTGVQTCALPIYLRWTARSVPARACGRGRGPPDLHQVEPHEALDRTFAAHKGRCMVLLETAAGQGSALGRTRSEERRVGKEGGARGWREQDRKRR